MTEIPEEIHELSLEVARQGERIEGLSGHVGEMKESLDEHMRFCRRITNAFSTRVQRAENGVDGAHSKIKHLLVVSGIVVTAFAAIAAIVTAVFSK